jgi:hypothetical protein
MPHRDTLAEKAEHFCAAELVNLLDESLRYPASNEPYVCYAARPNSLAIRADGTIAKSTVALRDARNAVGRLGTDGRVSIDSDRLGLWLDGVPHSRPQVFGMSDIDAAVGLR